MRNQCEFRVEIWGVSPFSDCSTKTFIFVEQSPWNNRGYFGPSCHAGLDPASQPIKGVGTQRVALEKARMRLRVKPAKTQIVSHLRMMYKYAAEKLCKKVAFSLRKPTALFRKMGTRIFFLEQPLVIRKIRVPLCSKVRNLFVEQSAPSQFPNKTEYQAFTRVVPRGTFCAMLPKMREKRRF